MEKRVRYSVAIPDREYFERNIPCRSACPIETECGRYAQAIGLSKMEEAYLLARAPNPFVYTLGRVCAHPCESSCRRGKIDEPVSICALKRFATDRHNLGLGHDPQRHGLQRAPRRNQRVAIVGSGVCGLTCAHDLALLGYTVEIFDQAPTPGGILYWGIPQFRLPREVIRVEVDHILSMRGVTLHSQKKLGRDILLSQLRSDFDAVLLALGLGKTREVKVPGMHLAGVYSGINFLFELNGGARFELGKRVAVVGGGNVAIDIARSAVRAMRESGDGDGQNGNGNGQDREELEEEREIRYVLHAARAAVRSGAEEVRMVSLESRDEMPAWKTEVEESEREGILLDNGWGIKEILGENGIVTGLRLRRCIAVFDERGHFNPAFGSEEKVVPCDSVIMAIGQQADFACLRGEEGVELTARGTIKVDDNLMTPVPGVFAGGDAALGPRVLVDAIAQGHKAARSIHRYFDGKHQKTVRSFFRIMTDWKMPRASMSTPRQIMPTLPANRSLGVSEVELGFDEEQGRAEGQRCLNCQVNPIFDGSKCILCGGCIDICPEFCLRLVDLVQVHGDERYDTLIHARYGVTALELKERQASAIIKNETKCIRCGLCALRCPSGAITMEALEQQIQETFA
jgi:formate dehydrogenase beta subunit